MIGFCPLASGSKGNSVFFSNGKTKLLIDAGISLRQLEKRLNDIDQRIEEIDAIFITHEHMDHIAGLKVISSKFNIPIVCNSQTAKGIYQNLHIRPFFKIFTTEEIFQFEDMEVHPFSIQHDTFDPVAFCIKWNDIKVAFCTDLGFVTTHVKKSLENCNYIYIEANHQPSLVYSCSRPEIYKQRVLGRQGHLSNEQCVGLLSYICHPNLKQVCLAHLSQECNSEELAYKIIKDGMKDKSESLEISIAYQNKVSVPVIFK
jgi:phosphoribosyl 1,2-cyclic phosphodiesterase